MKHVVISIPEIDYALVHWPENKVTPWVAAYGCDDRNDEPVWCQGHYFTTKEGAVDYLVQKYKDRGIANRIAEIKSA